jgi:cytochrome P450
MTLPPGPDVSPARQSQEWIDRPLEFWEECCARFGETFTLQLGGLGPTVLFSRPGDVLQVFQLPAEAFEVRPFNEPYEYVMGPRSLFVSDGAQHMRRRQLLLPAFQSQQVSAYAPMIRSVTRRVAGKWPVGQPFVVRPLVHLLSLQVILEILFSDRDEDIRRAITHLFATEVLQDLNSWRSWTRFGRLQPRFRELIAGAIARGRQAPPVDNPYLFDTLILARGDNGQYLPDGEIQDLVSNILIAGGDPTAIAITWALYWLFELPPVRTKVQEELATLGPAPDPGRLALLPYLTAFCQEALRIYPVAPTPSGRRLKIAVEIGGHAFEPGTTLLPCAYLVHRRDDLYPEAATFRPERFLERQFARHEYLPFGGGNRQCIGAVLGPLEMKIALATILAQWDLQAAHSGVVRPVRHGTLLAPSQEMRLMVNGPAQ